MGSGAPKAAFHWLRSRRNRAMGSSILASLSEAGGNDPYHPVNGPFLPVHLTMRTVSERDPQTHLVQLGCPTLARANERRGVANSMTYADGGALEPTCPNSIRERASRIGTRSSKPSPLPAGVRPHTRRLCEAMHCRIMMSGSQAACENFLSSSQSPPPRRWLWCWG